MDVVYSTDEEQELREMIKRLVQEERRIRNERHRLEERLRALVMARFMELYRRFGVIKEG
ncbi:MAG TPA: hypothetical protein VMW22_02965 [Candidatus Desulfaltia sp.]|nr:hypothetical protein [Candidatus Desulfaltia sp.]